MGKYWVLEPVTYVQGKKVVKHTRASREAVQIDDDVAKKLRDKVRRVGEPDPDAESDKSSAQSKGAEKK